MRRPDQLRCCGFTKQNSMPISDMRYLMKLVPPENLKRSVPETVRAAEAVLKGSTVTYQRATKSVCWSVKAILSTEEMPADSEETRLPPAPVSPSAGAN
jgi:hypothetical protein